MYDCHRRSRRPLVPVFCTLSETVQTLTIVSLSRVYSFLSDFFIFLSKKLGNRLSKVRDRFFLYGAWKVEYSVFGIYYIRDVLYLAYLNFKYPVLCDIVYFLYPIFENISYYIQFLLYSGFYALCVRYSMIYNIFTTNKRINVPIS